MGKAKPKATKPTENLEWHTEKRRVAELKRMTILKALGRGQKAQKINA